MKKVIALISAMLIFMSIPLTAFGNKIEIDGKVSDNKEWALGEYPQDEYLLTEKDPKNDSNYIDARCIFGKNDIAYFLINTMFDEYSKYTEEGKNNLRIIISFADGNELELYPTDKKSTKSYPEYTVTTYPVFLSNGISYVEMEVIYNDGYGENTSITVQTVDGYGIYSRKANFSFKTPNNPDYWANRTTTVTEITTKKTATTKAKTTKDFYATKKSADKTHRVDNVKKRTTTKKSTTVKARKTTTTAKAPKTTKIKTTKTKAVKTTRKTYTKVIKEKEIYIVEATTSADTTTLQAVTETVNTVTQTEKSAFSLGDISRSTLYKIITGICALLLFGVIGVWAVKSKDDNDDDNGNIGNKDDEEKTDE